jgi:hypothetical protein
MITKYREAVDYLADPTTTYIELECTYCREWIRIDVDPKLYGVIIDGCPSCGQTLHIRGRLESCLQRR